MTKNIFLSYNNYPAISDSATSVQLYESGLQRIIIQRAHSHGNGFTLIELMMVVAIIGTLSAIAVPFFIGSLNKARNTRAIADLKTIEREIVMIQVETGLFPDSLADIGLDTLKDAWGRPYEYLKIQGAKKNVKGKARKDHFMVPVNTDFDLYSMGPDGKSASPFTAKASRDDIVRANNGQYMGVASEY